MLRTAPDMSMPVNAVAVQPEAVTPRLYNAPSVAISTNFLAAPLRAPLVHWLTSMELASPLTFAPDDSVIQQLLDGTGALSKVDLAVVLIRLESWCHRPHGISGEIARENADIFFRSLSSAARRQPATTFLVMLCPSSPAFRFDQSIATASQQLLEACAPLANVELVSATDLDLYYPTPDYNAYFMRESGPEGALHYSELCYATLATMIARRINARFTQSCKVIAVDCDNTLWSGICGELGPLGVAVGPGHRHLQRVLLQQRDRGRLLCVCSKNNEADALAVFERNPEMLLRREHLSAIRINWKPKADNLQSLASELRLGLDTFVFMDDDAFECESVTALCPEIRTLRIACSDEAAVQRALLQVWDFDSAIITSEDKQRAAFYSQESQRDCLRNSGLSMQEFLETLDLKVEIEPLTSDGVNRAVQLTHRVNQFNLNGIRKTPAELHSRCRESACRLVSARDRFGDYGIVGLLIYDVAHDALTVEALALSCRALGRGVELRLAAYLAKAAQVSSCNRVEFSFLPTAKNVPMQEFLAQIGCATDASGKCVTCPENLARFVDSKPFV